MSDRGEIERVLTAYVEAVNRHDVDAMLELRHPDAYLEMMGAGPRIEGLEALRPFYERFLAAMPDYRLEIDGSAFGDDVGVVWGRFRGTVGESFMGAPASGGAVEVPVTFVCTFEDGRFRGDHMYFNAALVQQQAGLTLAG